MFCLNATLPVFFMMALGYILHRIGWVSDAFASGMNSFVFKLALPVSLFTELCDVDVAAVWDGWYILFCLVVTALSIFIAFLLSFLLKDKSVRGEFVQGAYRSSASLLGMTYLENMYSSAESGSLMMLGSVPLYNVAAVIVLSLMPGCLSETADSRGGAGGSGDTENSTVTGNGMTVAGSGDRENGTVTGNGIAAAGSGDRENSTVSADGRTIETGGKSAGVAGGRAEGLDGARMKKTLYGILTNPIIWGIFLGFGWALLKLPMPQMLDTTLNYIGRCASPMGLLAMGASLDFSALTKKNKARHRGFISETDRFSAPVHAAGCAVRFPRTGTGCGTDHDRISFNRRRLCHGEEHGSRGNCIGGNGCAHDLAGILYTHLLALRPANPGISVILKRVLPIRKPSQTPALNEPDHREG